MIMGVDSSSASATPGSRAPFVGRQPMLARLRRMLEQARAGQPRLVLIEGPAGIGKTTFVRRFLPRPRPAATFPAAGQASPAANDVTGWQPAPSASAAVHGFPLPNDANCVEDDTVHGWGRAGGPMAGPGRDDDHDQEVRFALALNGRVSLAIWMV